MHEGKRAAAEAAVEAVAPGMMLGVGTGSTVNVFIEVLAARGIEIAGAVASSEATVERLRAVGIEVLELNDTGPLALYVDGADAFNPALELVKGGGGALTREKIVAAASETFLCIVDASKRVERLGAFPVPVEVLPMARSLVAREIVALGADPELREGPRTDNGNVILDCHGWSIDDPRGLETALNGIAGVVCAGIFAHRPADQILVGEDHGGITRLSRQTPPAA